MFVYISWQLENGKVAARFPVEDGEDCIVGSFIRRTPCQMYVGRSVRGNNGRNMFRA